MNNSTKELLEQWVRYSTVYKNETESQEEIRNKRSEVKAELDKKGITEVELYGIDGDTYTLRYLYRISKVFSKVTVPSEQ